MMKLVYGVGVNDIPRLKENDEFVRSIRRLWQGIIERSFDEKSKERHPTYKDVSCSDDWIVFSKFLSDIRKIENNEKRIKNKWHFDKDILNKGNSEYSMNNCCFVPREINNLFTKRGIDRGDYPIGVSLNKASGKLISQLRTGNSVKYLGLFNCEIEAFNAYKFEKEIFVKEVANKWRGIIAENVYQAMINYKVEIND